MSRARHHTHKKEHEKHHAEGGAATETGGNPHVFKLAKEKHSIGVIDGEKGKPRLDRKRGGKVHRAHGGEAMKGSDTHPYSSAHKHGGKVHEGHHEGGHDGMHHGLHGAHKKEHHKEHEEHKKGGRC